METQLGSLKLAWVMLSDEQMSKRLPFSLLNDEQMSNKVRVEHQPAAYSNTPSKVVDHGQKKSWNLHSRSIDYKFTHGDAMGLGIAPNLKQVGESL